MASKLSADRQKRLKRAECFTNMREFGVAANYLPDRVRIVSEGDSWFDYPKKMFSGKPANIIDHIQKKVKGKALLLRRESNGDEITQMLSGKQRHEMTKLLERQQHSGKPVHALMFSGGGNDIVGKYDMERFLLPYAAGTTPADCINRDAFDVKIDQIRLAYLELFDIRNQYSPDTKIFTHTYDLPYITGKGARYFGIKVSGPWISPAMKKRNLPLEPSTEHQFRRDVINTMFERISTTLQDLVAHPFANGKFFVTPTLGTLTSKSQWRNEIHPTSKGFGLIADKVYDTLKANVAGLP